MGGQPLVSILMPCKNAAPWIAACIESILAQTMNDWELIAVDDRSDDDTASIIAAYAAKDRRVRLLYSGGHGIIPALQKAYAASRGVYITRMDADDLMSPDKIGALVDQIRGQGRGVVAVGWVTYFSSDGVVQDGYASYARWLNELTTSGRNFDEIYKECSIPMLDDASIRSRWYRCF